MDHPSTEDCPVQKPKHYTSLGALCPTCSRPIECLDVVKHMNFNLGNVVKYVWRSDLKGKRLEDLKKAKVYLETAIELAEDDERKKCC